ncbi:hypothetical protein O8W32_00530 [Methanomassiliicoccales archaeon LGM-DZ1]|nr:hypothetical protein O8W32_00530 [Methanomassiliicoccales archaeon LGM-DZ1]
MSAFRMMDLSSIPFPVYASPRFTQEYTALLLSAAIFRNGILIIPGVFPPTPSSMKRTRLPSVLSRNSRYLPDASYHPLSCTNLPSTRRLGTIRLPHLGQRGMSSEGMRMSFCSAAILRTAASSSYVSCVQGTLHWKSP